MFTLYVVKDYGNKLKVFSKHQYKPIAFDRLERILSLLGFKYYRDYTSVSVYNNNKNYRVGDIIELSSSNIDTIFHKTYYSDVVLGDYSDNMIIKLIK